MRRASGHAKQLLDLIASFPINNPSSSLSHDKQPETDGVQESTSNSTSEQKPVDLAALLAQIRSRYRLLCSSLGVRPRLATSSVKRVSDDADEARDDQGAIEGIDGPMKGVNTKELLY